MPLKTSIGFSARANGTGSLDIQTSDGRAFSAVLTAAELRAVAAGAARLADRVEAAASAVAPPPPDPL